MEGRKNGSVGNQKAREYLSDRFASIGLNQFDNLDGYKQHFEIERWLSNITGVNIVGWIQGSLHPDKFIVVSAHYDHIGTSGRRIFNGADDNASGVAAILALAKELKHMPPQHSVIFIATDAEEKGLLGAKAFLESPPVAVNSIQVNLNLDMLSQGGFKKRLYVYGPRLFPQFSELYSEVADKAGLCLKRGRQPVARGFAESRRVNWRTASDHGAFYKKGIPFLFVGVNEHQYYHTENDTYENIESDFYVAAVETSLKILLGMDKRSFANYGLSAAQ